MVSAGQCGCHVRTDVARDGGIQERDECKFGVRRNESVAWNYEAERAGSCVWVCERAKGPNEWLDYAHSKGFCGRGQSSYWEDGEVDEGVCCERAGIKKRRERW